MQAKQITADIIVVGAGAIGAACALQIARLNPDLLVVVLERQAEIDSASEDNKRVWALGAAATSLLDGLGVFSKLEANSCHPYSKMMVWDANSDGELHFDAAENESETLGHMIDADQCTHLLQNALREQDNIEPYYQVSPVAIDFSAARPVLTTESGSFVANLVVAADGANSWVRQQAKIFAPSTSYGQHGLVAKIKTKQSHQDTAWQCFLSSGPIAVLPLAENQSSIVWSCSNEMSRELLALSSKQFEKKLQACLQNRLGEVTLLSDVFSFPLQSRQAQTYTKRAVALIGDAAHSIHPLAGQGANLGFKDAIELANLIGKYDQLDNPELLRVYQRSRRSDNLQTDFFMTTLHHAYKLNLPIWSLLRGTGMNWVSANPLVKNQFARQAMGL